MKELSIEEKAKRYDGLIERLKDLKFAYRFSPLSDTIEEIFPELKPEDERIRKDLITFLDDIWHLGKNANFDKWGKADCSDWMAWLEKQGEKAKYHDICDKCVRQPTCQSDCFLQQGEQKPTLPKWKYKKDNTPLLRDSLILNKYGCVAKSPSGAIASDVWIIDYDELAKLPKEESEKQGEQILANSVKTCKDEQKPAEWEPQTGDTFRKKGTISPTYHLCNKREDGITFGFVENREVGICGGEISVFALRNNYELVERPKSIEDVVEEELNKDLQTKVEQKSAWSEEDEYMLYGVMETESYMLDVVNRIKEFDVGNDDIRKACIKELDWLKSLKDRVQPQPKQEWSEEDESNISELCSFITESYNKEDASELRQWLKSLKDRVQSKPAWSEEDEDIIEESISNWLHENNCDAFDKYGNVYVSMDNLKELVKSLRSQPHWKPSEEQMKVLQWCMPLWVEPKSKAILESLINDLKKLREE